MRKLISLLSLGSLVLLLNSCEGAPSSEQAQNSPPRRPKPTVSPNSVVIPPVATSSLIASTDPAQRRQEVQKGRSNPFALLPVAPIVTAQTSAEGQNAPKENNAAKNSVKGTNGEPSLKPKPDSTQSPKITYIEVPAPPIPNEARGVLVSGVINIGSSLVAIVKAPSEPVARQVMPGTILSNGLVRVKAIDNFSEVPSVILEQYGMEVVRSVGQAPEPPLPPPPPKRIPVVSKQAPVKATSASFSPLNH